MLDAAICPWCGDLEETSLHAIIRCQRVMELWEDSGCKELVEYEGESWCELLESWKQRDVKLRQKAAILAWNIWMERNLKVFEDKSSPNAMILARVTRLAHEHDMFTKQVRANYVPRHPRSANS